LNIEQGVLKDERKHDAPRSRSGNTSGELRIPKSCDSGYKNSPPVPTQHLDRASSTKNALKELADTIEYRISSKEC
jgi:hypothetical protein